MRIHTVEPLGKDLLEDIGLTWHTEIDGSSYVGQELVEVSVAQAEAYYAAANALYDMFIEVGQHIIDEQLYTQIGIPSTLIGLIEDSWEQDDLHLYGRFDLAGGLDGLPIKLIEFNADTPTSLFETSIVQWALLKANHMDETAQFNNLHEMLQENFRRLITGEAPPDAFPQQYRGQKILFSSAGGYPEDERTTRYLQDVATEAGFYTDYCYLHQAGFTSEEGVFNADGQLADFWFKLYPWEDIAAEELELMRILDAMRSWGQTRVLNPAYTLLFQSKGTMALLYELFPDSPYLLPTAFEPLDAVAQVSKKMFGREGANMALLDSDGTLLSRTDGPYDHHKTIYQQRAAFPQDSAQQHYQAGVFFAWEACGLGFRRGGAIIDDRAKFVGHLIA